MIPGETTTGFGCTTALAPVLDHLLGSLSLSCELDPEPVAGRSARRTVREHFSLHFPGEDLGDIELVVGELVANAASASPATGRVQFNIRSRGTALLVEVFDQAFAAPTRRCPDEWSERGRGLLLVAELSLAWGWHPVPGGKVVWSLVPLTSRLGSDLERPAPR